MSEEQSEAAPEQSEAKLTGVEVRLAWFVPPTFLTRAVSPGWSITSQSHRPAPVAQAAHLLLEGDPGLARADESPAFNEGRAGLRAAHVDVEHCAANADRSRRRVDRVRLLVQAACREAKDSLGEIDGDFLGVGVPFVDEAIENNPGGWADSEVGRIEKDEFGEQNLGPS